MVIKAAFLDPAGSADLIHARGAVIPPPHHFRCGAEKRLAGIGLPGHTFDKTLTYQPVKRFIFLPSVHTIRDECFLIPILGRSARSGGLTTSRMTHLADRTQLNTVDQAIFRKDVGHDDQLVA